MKNNAVIVLPIHKNLTPKEEKTLNSIRHKLSGHDKVIISPIGFDLSNINTEGFGIKRLSKDRFKTNKSGLSLLTSQKFYKYFKNYEYILYVKPGCLILGNDDDLREWTSKKYSYIGAPWFKKNKEGRRSIPGGVGKGAISLRKTSDFIEIFNRKNMYLKPNNNQSKDFFLEWRYWNRLKRFGSWVNLQKVIRPKKGVIHHITKKFDKDEEIFWAFFAVQINPKFKIPIFDEGYKFAIEETPYKIFEENLPFGITDKAWAESSKWDTFIKKHFNEIEKSVSINSAKKQSVVKKKATSKKKVTPKKKK